MKRITMLMCVLFLMGGSAYAHQTDTSGGAGSQIQGGSSQSGSHTGPPAEAYTACKSKKVGEAASFVNPRGETVTGTCAQEGSQLVLRPNNGKGQANGKRQGPPPEAYKACEGKSVGATAQFVSPRGETLIGTCAQEGSQLVLRPNSNKGGKQGQSNE